MANIADGAGGPVDGPALLRLGRVLEILKGGRPAEPDGPVHARRALPALIVQDQQLAEDRPADGAGMREPLRGAAEREAVGLRGAVVLGDDRAEPGDHRLL